MSGRDGTLRRVDLDPDPAAQFRRWYGDAEAAVDMPEAVALATADAEGLPSVRMVLAKGLDDRGFKFHTGHGSRKARELAATGRGALLFYWAPLGRQVRVEGPVEREFEGKDVPLPPHWGGYRLEPETWEFWQHRDSRLHDRFRYSRQDGGGWTIERLAP